MKNTILTAMFISLFLFSGTVLATSYIANNGTGSIIEYTFDYPYNNSNIFQPTMWINLTVNDTVGRCSYQFNSNGTWFNMTNTTDDGVNTTWMNSSLVTVTSGLNSANSLNNISFKCYTGDQGNQTNTTAGVYGFRVWSGPLNINVQNTIINGSTYSYQPVFNISTNHSCNLCYYVANKTTPVVMSNTTAWNWTYGTTGDVSQWFSNVSALVSFFQNNVTGHILGNYHNVSFYCTDAYGNKSWANVSAAASKYWKLDWVNPIITSATYTLSNITSGNYINALYNITDNSTITGCGIRLIYPNGTIKTTVADSFINQTNPFTAVFYNMSFCKVNVSSSDISIDGKTIIQPFAIDSAVNYGYANANATYNIIRMKAGWNLIGMGGNNTLSQIASWVPNVTYVSWYNNSYLNKTFLTYTVGGATNSGQWANTTNGSVWVYVTQDVLMARPNVVSPRFNATLTASNWTAIVLYAQNKTINETLWSNGCFNDSTKVVTNETKLFATSGTEGNLTDYSKIVNVLAFGNTTEDALAHITFNATGIQIDSDDYLSDEGYNITYIHTPEYAHSNCANITSLTFYDATLGQFCSASRYGLAVSCGNGRYTTTNLTIPIGMGVFVYSEVNQTFNTTAY